MNTKHRLFIISGPSAVGKTTIAKHMFKRLRFLQRGISYTTRPKRTRAVEDKIMRYVTEEEFKKRIENRAFIEWSNVYGNYYGTDKRTLFDQLRRGHVLLNLDVHGALRIKKRFPSAVLIFIRPDSYATLRTRLYKRLKRHAFTPEDFRLRLRGVRKELAMGRTFDHQVINRERHLAEAVHAVESIITGSI